MQILVKNRDGDNVSTFEGSVEETAQQFIDYIRDGKYKIGETYPTLADGTTLEEIEGVFDIITYHVVKEDLLKDIGSYNNREIHIESGLNDGLYIDGKRLAVTLTKNKDGKYEANKPFVPIEIVDTDKIEEENKGKPDNEQIKSVPFERITVYEPKGIGLDKDGNLTGGRPKLMNIREMKAVAKVFEDLNAASF